MILVLALVVRASTSGCSIASISDIASARETASLDGISLPYRPSPRSSATPPTSVEITGNPAAMASIIELGMPSAMELMTKQSAQASSEGTSLRRPVMVTLSLMPAATNPSATCSLSLPSPTMSRCARSFDFAIAANASVRYPRPFVGTSLPTKTNT